MQRPATRGVDGAATVCAVFVTYHPDARFADRLPGVAAQVGGVVIVDNGSGEAALAMLGQLSEDSRVSVVRNAGNVGLAEALNLGLERAQARGFASVVLFDQDSQADEDLVATLLAVRAATPDPARVAVVGAGFRERHRPERQAAKLSGDLRADDVPWAITSGSLLWIATHAAVGPFRADFFIDYVDAEYCLRARALGLRVIKTRTPLMTHSVGAPSLHRFLWMKKWTSNHAPARRYYVARNHTVMLRESGRYPAGVWAIAGLLACLTPGKRIVFYEARKREKLAALLRGWWDGVRGRLGAGPFAAGRTAAVEVTTRAAAPVEPPPRARP
jgi:rhamnosyltransferase